MSTNTLIEETISILQSIRPKLIGTQEEMCGYAIDNLRLAVWLIEGQYEVNTDPPVS